MTALFATPDCLTVSAPWLPAPAATNSRQFLLLLRLLVHLEVVAVAALMWLYPPPSAAFFFMVEAGTGETCQIQPIVFTAIRDVEKGPGGVRGKE
jgi:hypothetical protein